MKRRRETRDTRRRWKLAALGLAVILLGMQLFPPAPPRPTLPGHGTISDHVPVSPRVDSLLRRACYDCHSGETRWPWYSRVAPVSWLVANDVRHGRSDLDFSSWPTDPVQEPTPIQRVRWICQESRENTMPPRLYRFVHPEARLSEGEVDAICAWSAATLEEIR